MFGKFEPVSSVVYLLCGQVYMLPWSCDRDVFLEFAYKIWGQHET